MTPLTYLACRVGDKAIHSVTYNTVVGEQPYKSRDMVGSDSGLGRLLVNINIPWRNTAKQLLPVNIFQYIPFQNFWWLNLKSMEIVVPSNVAYCFILMK